MAAAWRLPLPSSVVEAKKSGAVHSQVEQGVYSAVGPMFGVRIIDA